MKRTIENHEHFIKIVNAFGSERVIYSVDIFENNFNLNKLNIPITQLYRHLYNKYYVYIFYVHCGLISKFIFLNRRTV